MKSRPFQRPAKPERPTQDTPEEIVNDLLGAIRGQFYGDLEPQRWFEDQHFLRRNVVLWFAGWLNGKALTLPPARYKQIVLEALDKAKIHGNLGGIRYLPGYLMKVVQDHIKFHADEINEEAKALRNKVEIVLGRAKPASPAVDAVQAMAAALSVLKTARRAKRGPVKAVKQGELSL